MGDESSRSDSEVSVASGLRQLPSGKYGGKSYAEVFDLDANYCEWVVGTAFQTDPAPPARWLTAWFPFIAYVQHRWLHKDITVRGRRGCLEGNVFAITGLPAEAHRSALEELVVFFGGEVTSGVRERTTTLVMCSHGQVGESKLATAHERRLPVMSAAELLE